MSEIFFQARNIVKQFGATKALNGVSIEVCRGEIVGLIGENGSGKSTLSSIISGMLKKTDGEMYVCGKPYAPTSAIDGENVGIGMIVQEQGTVGMVTVAENIFLGNISKFSRFGFVNKTKMNREAQNALAEMNLDYIKADTPIDSLDFQNRKLIEVARVMYAKPELFIVDETTTALSMQGREVVYELCKRQKAENKSVLFISHDLDELMRICDRLVVLRDGFLTAMIERKDYDEKLIKKQMVGREMAEDYYPKHELVHSAEKLVEVKNVTTFGGLNDCSMSLNKGEILGIGGLSNSGMHDLGKVIFGAIKPLMGTVTYVPTGEYIDSVDKAMKFKMGYVPKDRDKEALVLDAPIKDNIAICGMENFKDKVGHIKINEECRYVDKLIDELSIKCEDASQYVQALSGGNKQKVAFAKWIGNNSDILIMDCPTRGVDIGVKVSMYQLMYNMKLAGKSILMISEELTEIIGMSDRVLIIKDGKITKEVTTKAELDESNLINYMI